MGGDGFYFEDWALEQAKDRLGLAADALDEAAGAEPPEVDAGANSQLVAEAMATSQRLAVALAQHLTDVGENVDAAQGTYHEVENNAKGELRYEEDYAEHENDRGRAGSG